MSRPTPAVSVVMPAYDAEATIGAAVTSILGQDVDDLELVVVDDGSRDGTRDALADISDPRVRVVAHDTNRGAAVAGRTGIANARAPLIARMDADDVALPHRLARQLAIFRDRPRVGLVATAFVSVDEAGHEESHGVPPDHAAAWLRLHFGNCIAHASAMFRRDVYDTSGGYDPRAAPAEDHALWLRMAELTEIATIPDPLLRYRRSSTSLTSRFPDQMERTSSAAAAAACQRTTGRPPSARVLAGLRQAGPAFTCADTTAVLDVVLGVYAGVRGACRSRGIPTRSLPGQLAAVLAAGGLRRIDGRWCPGVAGYLLRHPRRAAALGADRIRSAR